MIVVTVEIWPQGDEAARRTIATARIANVSGGSAIVTEQGSVVCDYAFAFEEATSGLVPYPLETQGLGLPPPAAAERVAADLAGARRGAAFSTGGMT